MQGSKTNTAVVQFGPFELNLKSGELRREGMRIKLQPQPRQILLALLKTPGAIVTREQLRRQLWPEDTFVDFESGLNTAVNRLRIALGDSAEHPRYIETLSRSGYRFICLPNSSDSAATDPNVVLDAVRARIPGLWKPILIAAGCICVALGTAAFVAARSRAVPVRFQQLTFGRGQVSAARFTSSQEVVYTAQWERAPRRFFLADLRSPVPRLLGFENLNLQAVSSSGELAVLQGDNTMNIAGGTLSRVMRNGGPSTLVAPHVFSADWSPGGNQLAFVRVVEGAQQLEFPSGRVLYKTSGWLGNVRISPSGDRIAFIDHPVRHDDAGAVKIVDAAGNPKTLSWDWASVSGLSWRNSGEVWFTATKDSSPRSLWAVTADGGLRSVGQAPGILTLRDISPDGRVLVTVESRRLEMAGRISNEKTERDFSLTDWSRVQQLSGDGSLLLFDESGEGSGSHPIAYVRNTRTGQTVRLGEGWAQGLAPDGSSALLISEDRKEVQIVPVSGGPARPLDGDGLKHQWARFFPDGGRLLTLAAADGEPLKLYVRPLRGPNSMPLTGALMVRNVAISPDGKSVAALTPEGKLALIPVASGSPVYLPSDEPLAPIRWSGDGQWLFVQHLGPGNPASAKVSKIRVKTGEIRYWKTIAPADPIGVNSITGIVIADHEQSYAYSYRRVLSGLYVASGWR
jgi:DNA-binding winged helix-turn-helix (wHTH) protein